MKYQIINENTGLVEYEDFDREETYRVFNESYSHGHYMQEIIPCRGCEDGEGQEQYDAHGISTGYWCYECYDSNRYPYRKDKYPTIETHGYGERLENDY
jgi:hypothetical protein